MASPFSDLEVDEALRPQRVGFDLEAALSSVVVLHARAPKEAFTATTLGTERLGNAVVIRESGLLVTIGYLVTEADEVRLFTNDGREIEGHVLGYDAATGFGLVHALEPLRLPALEIGDSRRLVAGSEVVMAGGGGAAHAVGGVVVGRAPFAGYWEYLIDQAIYTAPNHPHWSGAAVIGPMGELLGIGSLQMTHETAQGKSRLINMSVPTEHLLPVLDDLTRGRAAGPPRPWLGLYSQEVGGLVMVLDVAEGGPAARAQIRRGDIVLAVGDSAVGGLAEFYARLWTLGPAGTTVRLKLQRQGDVFDVDLRSVDRAARLHRPRYN